MKEINELRQEILTALKAVTTINAPNIHDLIQTKEGYSSVEVSIIQMVLATGQTPAMCIPQIETEL